MCGEERSSVGPLYKAANQGDTKEPRLDPELHFRCSGLERRFDMLTILDEHTREYHVLRADRALKSGDVISLVGAANSRDRAAGGPRVHPIR